MSDGKEDHPFDEFDGALVPIKNDGGEKVKGVKPRTLVPSNETSLIPFSSRGTNEVVIDSRRGNVPPPPHGPAYVPVPVTVLIQVAGTTGAVNAATVEKMVEEKVAQKMAPVLSKLQELDELKHSDNKKPSTPAACKKAKKRAPETSEGAKAVTRSMSRPTAPASRKKAKKQAVESSNKVDPGKDFFEKLQARGKAKAAARSMSRPSTTRKNAAKQDLTSEEKAAEWAFELYGTKPTMKKSTKKSVPKHDG